MGKAKKSKKNHFSGSTGILLASDANKFRGNGGNDRFKLTELEADLGNLDESKRRNACALLSDLYLFNSQNRGSMEAIASNKVLSKLAMRLVDHSILVRIAATKALKTLTESKDEVAVEKIISIGIFRSVFTLAVEIPSQFDDNIIELQQNFLYIIANILSLKTEAVEEIIQHKPDFFSILLSLFQSNTLDLRLINTIANFFMIVSKLAHPVLMNQVIGSNGINIVQGKIAYLLHSANLVNSLPATVAAGGSSVANISFAQQDPWIIVLQCVEIVLNFYFNPTLDQHTAQSISIASLFQLISQIWSACLQVKVNLQELTEQTTSLMQQQLQEKSASSVMVTEESDDQLIHLAATENTIGSISTSRGSGAAVSFVNVLQQTNRFLFHVELIEMISDWISTMSHSLMNPTLLQSLGTSQATIFLPRMEQFVHQMDQYGWNDMHLQTCLYIHHLLPSFILPQNHHSAASDGTTTTTTTASELFIITPTGVQTFEILERIIQSFSDMEQMKSYFLQQITPLRYTFTTNSLVKFDLPWTSFLDHLSRMYDYLSNVTPLLDPTTNSAYEKWKAQEHEKIMSVKTSIINTTIHSLEYLCNLSKHMHIHLLSPISIFPPPIDTATGLLKVGVLGGGLIVPSSSTLMQEYQRRIVITEEELKQISKLILQYINVPQLEIVLQCTTLMQQYFLAGDTTTSTPTTSVPSSKEEDEIALSNALFRSRVSMSILTVLSNVLLQRILHPNTFAYFDLDHKNSNDETKGKNKATSTANNSKQMNNVTHSQLVLLDACLNTFIDLHALDIAEGHTVYNKLHSSAKLEQSLQMMNTLYASISSKLPAEEQETYEETMMNVMNFVEYKQQLRL